MATQTVIEGVVTRAGAPVVGAYVRLLDRTGEFTAEVPTSDTGRFRFFAGPGSWTVRALTTGGTAAVPVVAAAGAVTRADVAL